MARRSRVNKTVVWNAAIYSRLSVEDGDDIEQNSIGNQKKIGVHYLAEKIDVALVDTYSDNGYTGMNYDRPDFKRLFEDLKSHRINCIIVKDISRLGRNFVLTSDFVERIFPEMGVRLICINDDYDSIDANADSSALTLPLKMVMNDYYEKDISRKIRASINAKMDNGEYLPSASSIPYGYIRDPENNTFAIDRETAPIILRIFEMRSSGMSFNAISKTLNEEKISCPGKIRYERGVTNASKYKNALWIRGTIRKITQDKVYIGCRIHGRIKRDKVGLDKKRRPENEWTIIENSHPAIISLELFDAVQNVNAEELEKRQKYVKRNDCDDNYRKLFEGIVHCAECGSLMTAAKGCARVGANTPSRIFYDCNTYRYSTHIECCSHYIRQEQIYAYVKDALDQQVKISIDVEELIAKVKALPKISDYLSQSSNQLNSITAQRRNLETRIERLLISLTDRIIDRSEYEYMKSKYSQQLEELLAIEAKTAATNNAFNAVLASTNQWLDAVKKYHTIPELNPEIIKKLVKDILVFKDRHIKVVLNYADPYKPITQFLDDIKEVQHVG